MANVQRLAIMERIPRNGFSRFWPSRRAAIHIEENLSISRRFCGFALRTTLPTSLVPAMPAWDRRALPSGSWAVPGSAQQMLEDGQRCLAYLFGFTLDAAILLQPVWPGVISLA